MSERDNKEVLLMYSGGLDSMLSCIRLINAGFKVYLIHFYNGSIIGEERVQIGAEILKERYNERVEYLGVVNVTASFRDYRYYAQIENLNAKELYEKHGNISISQYRCLVCRMAMYTYSISLARKMNIKYIAEGARKSQLFAIEQEELLNEFKNLCSLYGIELLTPVYELVDDFAKENEIFRNGITPSPYDSKCLLGYPMDRELTKEEIEDIKRLYLGLQKHQIEDINKKRVVLSKLPKDKITWH